jgi:hypothetical protein
MFKKRTSTPNPATLPWYLNNSLPEGERAAAEEQARRAPQQLAAWQVIKAATLSQPTQLPAPAVRRRVLAQARVTARRPRWLPTLSGALLAVLALLVLWNAVQPGIGLQWTVAGDVPTAFRVYRAPTDSDRFEFVREVPAQAGVMNYTYVDTALWPGQTYRYRVEAVNTGTASATIAANGAEVLPLQLAIVLSSLFVGLAGAYALQEMGKVYRPGHWRAV